MAHAAQAAAKSVKMISKDFIKINKKNTRSAKNKESYYIYIYKFHPESGIRSKSTSIMNRFANDVFDQINIYNVLFKHFDSLKRPYNNKSRTIYSNLFYQHLF